MDDQELRLAKKAKIFLKANKDQLIAKFTTTATPSSEDAGISLFMAGSPGAGKTEFSKRLIERFKTKPIIIDADEIRKFFPEYVGTNAHIFQNAATKGVHILYDYSLDKNLNVILDGTFAYAEAIKNVRRSLDRGRKVEIFYLYQDPEVAWDFTKRREEIEKRKVSRDVFIRGFIEAKNNANKAKEVFGDGIELNLFIKNFTTGKDEVKLNIEDIDQYLPKIYTVDNLNNILL